MTILFFIEAVMGGSFLGLALAHSNETPPSPKALD